MGKVLLFLNFRVNPNFHYNPSETVLNQGGNINQILNRNLQGLCKIVLLLVCFSYDGYGMVWNLW